MEKQSFDEVEKPNCEVRQVKIYFDFCSIIVNGDNMDLWMYEKELYKDGIEYIGGVDEVGRGPLIGNVVAACCVLPKDFKLDGLNRKWKYQWF